MPLAYQRSFLFQSVAFVQTVIDSALHSSFVNLLSCLPFPVMYVVPFCFCALLFGECIDAPRMDQCRFLSVRMSVAIILFHDHFIHLFQSTAFSPLCLMSSITLTGFFGLLHGKGVSHPEAGDSSVVVHHAVYSSVIQCTLSDVGEQPMAIPAEIRLWCPLSQPLHPDNTVAFIVAKAYIPSPGSLPNVALLDTLYLVPFPGDTDTDEYEDHIPDFPNPLVATLGTISASGSDLSTGHHCFPLSVREYVRDENKNSVIL